MATNTYVALATQTVTGSAVTSVTLDVSGITGYTDLVVVGTVQGASGSAQNLLFQLNNDNGVGTLYSSTWLNGNGTTAASSRLSSRSSGYLDVVGYAPIGSGFNNFIAHFNNYSNTTTNKTVLVRANSAATGTDAIVSLWRNTNAITSIKLFFTSNSISVGSTFTVYGIANADNFVKATGGIISEDSTYTYHVFGSSGTFTPKQSLTADILVVAGGGGGGSSQAGGGGGAGGLLYFSSQALTATGYTVTVGAGGVGTSTTASGVGGDSRFGALTLVKGGGGGGTRGGTVNGGTGGSGGGGTYNNGTGGAATSGQGYAGGNGNSSNGTGGGGGGAAAAGTASVGQTPGSGGNGLYYDAFGLATSTGQLSGGHYYYAGGGSGGSDGGTAYGTPGLGGGGYGSAGNGPAKSAGLANTGGGGGGAGYSETGMPGGSGVVIIRYPK